MASLSLKPVTFCDLRVTHITHTLSFIDKDVTYTKHIYIFKFVVLFILKRRIENLFSFGFLDTRTPTLLNITKNT